MGRGGAAPIEPRKEMVAPPEEQPRPEAAARDRDAAAAAALVAADTAGFSAAKDDKPGAARRPATTGLRLDFKDGGSEQHAACTSSFDDQYMNEMDRLIQEHVRRIL
jgi:hypothetical protein